MGKKSGTELLIFLVSAMLLLAQNAPSDLLTQALQNPNDENLVSRVAFVFQNSTDQRVIDGLRKMFQAAATKNSRQKLAVLLMNLGQKDDIYFDELAKYAREAVTTDALFRTL